MRPEHTKKNIANKAGYATIMIGSHHELVAVDRSGAVRIPNIFRTGDFDFPNANQGLGCFQIIADNGKGATISKCGYFDGSNFKITTGCLTSDCSTEQTIHLMPGTSE